MLPSMALAMCEGALRVEVTRLCSVENVRKRSTGRCGVQGQFDGWVAIIDQVRSMMKNSASSRMGSRGEC